MRISSNARLAAVIGAAAIGAAGCGGGGGEKRIALLLPESKTTRYEAQDRPYFTAGVERLCPECDVISFNASQDAAKQQQQAEAAIVKGAKVLVIDPVDSASARAMVARAQQSDVPVVSYDRLIVNADVDYYISFDNERVGRLQGETLLQAIRPPSGKKIVMINGAPTDNNAKLFKRGAHSVLDRSGVTIAREFDTPDWSPDKAQTQMDQAIASIGKDIHGVYAANDGTAGGAIAAMKGRGVSPSKVPVTGQDAELAAIQRILSGDQYMTVYKAIKPEAQAAARLAVALVNGRRPPPGLVNGRIPNGKKEVPSVLLEPVAVTKDNVKQTVVKDGFLKPSDICRARAAAACRAAGIA